MTDKRKRLNWAAALLFFIAALYIAESPLAGSQAVAGHNGGYGTFDMNSYDAGIVEQVLSDTDEGGLSAYNIYYVTDFLFIVAFGLLQLKISRALFPREKQTLREIAVGLPILRALLDSTENILLLIAINGYPRLYPELISISAIITKVKFAAIAAWVLLMLFGAVDRVRKKRKTV